MRLRPTFEGEYYSLTVRKFHEVIDQLEVVNAFEDMINPVEIVAVKES